MFKKSLEQENIFEEIKNGTGNVLVNAKAGTGKCLGYDTDVILFSGDRVKVQDIKVGDKLMGDNGEPRNVLSVSRGRGKLYKVIIPLTNEYFICNEDHILTCTNHTSKIRPLDISLTDIFSQYRKSNINNHDTYKGLYLYRYIPDFNIIKDTKYYRIGYYFFDEQKKYNTTIKNALKNRLLILSAIVDRYCIPQKHTILLRHNFRNHKNFELFKSLVRSCGFEYDKKLNLIDGDFSKLSLKNEEFLQYLDKSLKSNILIKKFRIEEYSDDGDYYGFTLDGNGRFLVNDFIVTHNTTTIVNSLEYIPSDKSIMMLAFNKHIAKELSTRVPNREGLRISTTHALGWGAIKRKHKDAILDDDKAYKVIRRKLARWNTDWVDNIDRYVNDIKKMVDLCRVTLTTRREYVLRLAENHSITITDEDARRILSVMEEMYNDRKTFDFVDMVYIPAIDNKIWLFPNDYVFVDECVSGEHNLLLKNDKYITIKELYEKHVDENGNIKDKDELPDVLSLDVEKNHTTYKKILNIVKKGKRKLKQTKLNYIHSCYTTESHLFYTTEGWREQKDLKKGDLVIANEYNPLMTSILPTDQQLDFIYGFMLTFGLLNEKNNSYKFRMYVRHNENRKATFINSIIPLYKRYSNDKLKLNEYVTYKFYINSEIFNKEDIIKNLTFKQLAITYIGGCKYFDDIERYGFYLSVNTFDEIVYAKELFEQRFNMIFDIKHHRKGSYLVPKNQDWFFENISEYLPLFMKKYVPEKFHSIMGKEHYRKNLKHTYCTMVTNLYDVKGEHDVYDLEVKNTNTFFLSHYNKTSTIEKRKKYRLGYLVHNCQDYNRAQQFILNKVVKKDTGRLISFGDESQAIYGFNGSGTDSFNWFRNKDNTTELPLTTSYRCAKRIIEYAQNIVPNIRYKHDAEDGEVINGSVLELAKAGDFVLARKNKPLVVLLFDLLRQNKMATIRGNDIGLKLANTIKEYKTIPELNEGLVRKLNEMRDYLLNTVGVVDFNQDPRYINLEDNIEIIRYLMNNSSSIERILEKLKYIFTDKPEGIILSTVHKSKGLEADRVFIIRPDEIRLKTPIPEMAIQEKHLEYIAITRAKKSLVLDTEWTDERD
mgnify:CR=1 FL=1